MRFSIEICPWCFNLKDIETFAPSPAETLQSVEAVYAAHFPQHRVPWLRPLFRRTEELFAGRYPHYQACDIGFHHFGHTCEVTAAVARIMDGNLRRPRRPLRFHARDYDMVIAAALLHDIGYLKKTGDKTGTGAKFTPIHVARGSDFAGRFLQEFNLSPDDIEVVQRLILWTAVNVDYEELQSASDVERHLGGVLATGDLLGQMAAPDYPQRLEALYVEFSEAARNVTGNAAQSYTYATAADLQKKTRTFYEHYVMPILEHSFRGIFHDLVHHFPDGRNHYLLRIEENLSILDGAVPAER